jgi:hypothetical protein
MVPWLEFSWRHCQKAADDVGWESVAVPNGLDHFCLC